MIILIITSLIVIQIIQNYDYQYMATENEQKEVIEPKKFTSDLSVEVMRMSSEEIEDVPLEEYVIGVVAAEMPVGEFELEALNAQGLEASTFIVYHLLHEKYIGENQVTDSTA